MSARERNAWSALAIIAMLAGQVSMVVAWPLALFIGLAVVVLVLSMRRALER